jgi:hypothetical protein
VDCKLSPSICRTKNKNENISMSIIGSKEAFVVINSISSGFEGKINPLFISKHSVTCLFEGPYGYFDTVGLPKPSGKYIYHLLKYFINVMSSTQ